MRLLTLLSSLIVFPLCHISAAEASPAPAKESVKFDGQTLVLTNEEKSEAGTLKEYIPAGEKFEAWTKLAAIRVFAQLDDPVAAAVDLQRELKKQYPDAPSRLLKNPKTGDAEIDFIVLSADNAFVEFNVFKYSKSPGGGVISQQYAIREYKDIEGFLKGLKPVKERLVNLMVTGGLLPGK